MTRNRHRASRIPTRFAVEGLEERALMALAIASIQTVDGVPFSGIAATLLRSDINGMDLAACAARVVWGDGTDSPAALRVDPTNPMGNALQVVTIAPHEFPDVGSYPVTVSVTCGDAVALFAEGNATVSSRTLVLTAVPLTVVSSEVFADRGIARFRAADPASQASDFEATMIVGQNAPIPATVVRDASGEFQVRLSGSFAQPGAVTATVRVAARDGTSGSVAADIIVERAPIQATGQETALVAGAPASIRTLAIFTDSTVSAEASDYQAFVTLPNQSQTLASVQKLSDGRFSVSASVAAVTPGQFTVPVRIIRLTDNLAATAEATIRVGQTSIAILGQDVALAANESPSNQVLAIFTDASADAQASDYQAFVTLPNQSQTLASIQRLSDGRFSVSALISATAPGQFAVPVRVTRLRDGLVASANSTLRVEQAPISVIGQEVALTAGALPSIQVLAIFTDARINPRIDDYQAFVTLPNQSPVLASVQKLSDGRFTVSASVAAVTPGQFTVPIRIIRLADNLAATAEATIRVGQTSIAILGQDVALAANEPPSNQVLAIFTDASVDAQASDYQAFVTLPNQSQTLASIQRLSDGRFAVSALISATAPGQFAVPVRVTRLRDGLVASANSTLRVEQAPISVIGQEVALTAGALPSIEVLAIFTDARINPRIDDYQAFVTLPNQSPVLASIQKLNDGRFSVSAPVAAATSGQFTVSVRIIRLADGSAATANATLRAERIPINAIGQTVALIAGAGSSSRDLVVFFDGRANALASDYQAIVTLPDQSQRLGTIRALSGGRFVVAAPVSAEQAGASAVQVSIARTSDGQVAVVTASLQVANPVAPAIDPLVVNGIIRTRQFRIQGSSPAGSVILLYAQRVGRFVPKPIGRAVADEAGRWSIRVGPLADGRYVIRALVAPPNQSPFEIALAGAGGETTPLRVATKSLNRGRPASPSRPIR